MYSMSGLGQEQGFCTSQPGMCFNSFASRDSARSMCQSGYVPSRMPGPCPVSHVIGSDDVYRFRPCDIAHFNICQTAAERGDLGPFAAQQQFDEGVVVEDTGDDYKMYYVLGGVALVAIGAGAYFFMKK